jgi:hypothetical protein
LAQPEAESQLNDRERIQLRKAQARWEAAQGRYEAAVQLILPDFSENSETPKDVAPAEKAVRQRLASNPADEWGLVMALTVHRLPDRAQIAERFLEARSPSSGLTPSARRALVQTFAEAGEWRRAWEFAAQQ